VGNTIYPALAKYTTESPEKLDAVMTSSVRVFGIVGLPIAVFVTFRSLEIIRLLFGTAFVSAAPALQLLVWSIVTTFGNAPFAFLLFAAGRQRQFLACTAIAACINLIAGFVLIPLLGIIGAAAATLMTELVLFTGFVGFGRRIHFVDIARYWVKPFAAAIILGLLLYFLPMNLLLSAIAAVVMYLAVLLLLRTFTKQDVKLIRDLLALKEPSME
jgi:O-antigen/teichoic acid export membrane protein